MKKKTDPVVDINETSTWIPFKKGMCRNCDATCCTMPVEVRTPDLVRMGLIDAFEAEDQPAKRIAKRLMRQGIVHHFNFKNSIFSLARKANDDCLYLDCATRRCTIYELRPDTCRNHPRIGPRSGYCPFRSRRQCP
jgi:hypothetical protein